LLLLALVYYLLDQSRHTNRQGQSTENNPSNHNVLQENHAFALREPKLGILDRGCTVS